MKISIYGSGYVGLVAAGCFAEGGNNVVCVDIDENRVRRLQAGEIPFFEPGLSEMVLKNQRLGRLKFTANAREAVRSSLFQFIAVGTPPDESGAADLGQVFSVAETIARHMDSRKILVDKSTVPVGTADRVKAKVNEGLAERGMEIPFSVVSNPEFLREGSAVFDFFNPDRVVVGCDDEDALESMEELYLPFLDSGEKLLKMDAKSAEMTKYAANAFLATKISFINEVANLCDKLGVNIDAVKKGIGTDARIGYHFLNPGIGYGGSCFPKDVQALIATGKGCGAKINLLEAVDRVNVGQKEVMFGKISQHFGGDLTGKRFAVWGLAFKPQTDDMREAPSLNAVRELLNANAEIAAYDPVAGANALKALNRPGIELRDNPYEVLDGADALIIFTEWPEFRRPDFDLMLEKLKTPLIFDGRNVYVPGKMRDRGFGYVSIGRPRVFPAERR